MREMSDILAELLVKKAKSQTVTKDKEQTVDVQQQESLVLASNDLNIQAPTIDQSVQLLPQ